MFRCGVYFQSIPSHKTYNFHQSEPIEYVNNYLGHLKKIKQMITKFT